MAHPRMVGSVSQPYPLFPKRVRLGQNRVGWVEDEVDEWIKDHIQERDSSERSGGDSVKAVSLLLQVIVVLILIPVPKDASNFLSICE